MPQQPEPQPTPQEKPKPDWGNKTIIKPDKPWAPPGKPAPKLRSGKVTRRPFLD